MGRSNSRRNTHLKTNYGMSLKEFNERLLAQGNKCPVCGREIFGQVGTPSTANKAVLDHCHKTKKNRGILCRNCNVGLGFFEDNIDALIGAVIYLKAFE